jgi:hypothetical protein
MKWLSIECLLPLYTKLLTGEGQRKTVEMCVVSKQATLLLSFFLKVWWQSKAVCYVAHYCFHLSYFVTLLLSTPRPLGVDPSPLRAMSAFDFDLIELIF